MPKVSALGLLPIGHEDICWHDACPSKTLAPVRLRVCSSCQVARYCSHHCQRRDWPRHKLPLQCAIAKVACGVARSSVRSVEQLGVVAQEFSDDTMGLLSSGSNVLGGPPWHFMRLTQQRALEKFPQLGIHRLTKAQWREKLALPAVAGALCEVWASVYLGELPGIPMAPVVDDDGNIAVRDIVRCFDKPEAVQCCERLAPLGLILLLLIRPSRAVQRAVREGRLGDGNYDSGFVYTPLISREVAGSKDWKDIIHLSVAASST